MPFQFCQGDEFDEPDCEPIEEHNAEVAACALGALEAGAEFTVERAAIEEKTQSRHRRLYSDGARGLDIAFDSLDITTTWEPVRVVGAPDASGCSEQEGSDAQWDCIEAAFDSAAEESSCYEAGEFQATE